MKTMKILAAMLLAAMALVVPTVADDGFAGYPYPVGVSTVSDSMFTTLNGTVTVLNPNGVDIISDIEFQTQNGDAIKWDNGDKVRYDGAVLKPGNNDFTVPLRGMGTIRVMIEDYYKYPQYDSDGKATTGTSIGMPKDMIEDRVDWVNQVDAPMYFSGTYLKAKSGRTMF